MSLRQSPGLVILLVAPTHGGCRVELFKSLNCLYHIHAEFVNDLLSFQDRLGFSQVPCEADIVVDGKFASPMSTSK